MISILKEERSFNKFCQFENRIFGCQASYGCRVACPLWRAREVEYLINEKGMTIGEAHKASIREELTKDEAVDAIRSAIMQSSTVNIGELIDILGGKKGDKKCQSK